jgi:ATP-dependent exoDNAse (exonuclease V) alpha subunit
MVADWVYHDAPGNPHVHLMTTLRPLSEDGFGAKKVAVLGPDGQPMRNDAGKIVYELWAGGAEDFNAFRDGWFAARTSILALAGLDIRIDGRSFEKQGIDLTPTIHLGVGATAIERKSETENAGAADGRSSGSNCRRSAARERRGASSAIPASCSISSRARKASSTTHDVAKILHRYIDDAAFSRA